MLVTAGEAGCSYAFHSSQGSKEVHKGYIPVLSVDVVETTGAGDAFLAGFLFGLVNVRLPRPWSAPDLAYVHTMSRVQFRPPCNGS